ncbi:MAG: acyl-CoA thioesterase [Archangiaceae bacterium]|nr:acyl-CoA thioesterase [Archangiaceae bacterium]
MPFVRELQVRFPDVDFARVVYYPRFFDYCHQVFEDFFAAEVGVPYARMLTERKVGFPSVHAEADFQSPLRFGDTARIELSCEALGESSLTCRYLLSRGQKQCASVKVVCASVDLERFTGVRVPDDVRAAFQRFR